MKPRRRLLLCLALMLFIGASLLHPLVHWGLIGWARGEAFYQGRPTSYWRQKIQEYQQAMPQRLEEYLQSLDGRRPASQAHWMGKVKSVLGLPADDEFVPPAVLGRSDPSDLADRGIFLLNGPPDPLAIPVLIELLVDSDPDVRWSAIHPLMSLGPQANKAIPSLRRLLKDNDWLVSGYAKKAIRAIDPEAAADAAP
jgi:hypothetical protein